MPRSRCALCVGFILTVAIPFRSARAQCPRGWSDEFPSFGINGYPTVMVVYDPDGPGFERPVIVAGGNFTTVDGQPTKNWATFDGRRWKPIATQNSQNTFRGVVFDADGDGPAFPMVYFARGGTVNNIAIHGVASWDGTQWADAGDPAFTSGQDLLVADMDGLGPDGDHLYALIYTTERQIARLDGNHWTLLGPAPNGATRLIAFDPDQDGPAPMTFYAGGGAFPYIWQYVNGVWSTFRGGAGGSVRDLAVFDLDGTGPAKPELIAAGQFPLIGGVEARGIAGWNGTRWAAVGGGLWQSTPDVLTVNCILPFDADGPGPMVPRLFAAGGFNASGTTPHLYNFTAWNGLAWQPLGVSLTGPAAMCVFDDDFDGPDNGHVYISAIGPSFSRLVNDTTYDSPNGRTTIFGSSAFTSLDTDGPDGSPPLLIAGGGTKIPGTTKISLGSRWDGRKWKPLIGPTPLSGGIQVMTTFDADGEGPLPPRVFAGGNYFSIAGSNAKYSIVSWDSHDWTPMTTSTLPGTPSLPGNINAMQVYLPTTQGITLSRLYVGGEFASIGGVPASGLAAWDGAAWTAPSPGIAGAVYSMCVFDDDGPGPRPPGLYLGGHFSAAGNQTVRGIVRWDGESWEPLIDLITGDEGARGDTPTALKSVFALTVADLDGDGPNPPVLVVGGDFTRVGTMPANRVAQWDGHRWSAIGAGFGNGEVYALSTTDIDGDGPLPRQLIAAGFFHQPASKIARWDGTAWIEIDGGMGPTPKTLFEFDDDGPAGPRNASLWVGGTFGVAGGHASIGIARHGELYPYARQDPESRRAVVGQTARLEIDARGAGPLTYQWRKDGAPISDGGPISGALTDTLRIADAQTSASGNYDVVVTGPCGQYTSDPATLVVCAAARRGDMNADGSVNGLDIGPFTAALTSGSSLAADLCGADVSADSAITLDDVAPFIQALLYP